AAERTAPGPPVRKPRGRATPLQNHSDRRECPAYRRAGHRSAAQRGSLVARKLTEPDMPTHALMRAARAVALALSLTGFGSLAADAQGLVPFRVGMAAPANTFLAIWMAQAAGFYEAQGLNVEIVAMNGGSESGPDLKSGRIHLMHIGMSSVVRANT